MVSDVNLRHYTVVVRVPPSCMLTAAAAMESDAARELVRAAQQYTPHTPIGDLALAVFVATDRKDPESPHASYYALLDADEDDLVASLPAW